MKNVQGNVYSRLRQQWAHLVSTTSGGDEKVRARAITAQVAPLNAALTAQWAIPNAAAPCFFHRDPIAEPNHNNHTHLNLLLD